MYNILIIIFVKTRNMIVTKINIEPHLAEYIQLKYGFIPESAFNDKTVKVKFPDRVELYHLIYDLLEKRPVNCKVDAGNVEIILPDRRIGDVVGGKSPEQYNYLGVRSQEIINKRIKIMLRAEMHTLLDENKHMYGIDYIQSVHFFMKKYCIESITEDALLKDYQRWRDSLKRKTKKRPYKRA